MQNDALKKNSKTFKNTFVEVFNTLHVVNSC